MNLIVLKVLWRLSICFAWLARWAYTRHACSTWLSTAGRAKWWFSGTYPVLSPVVLSWYTKRGFWQAFFDHVLRHTLIGIWKSAKNGFRRYHSKTHAYSSAKSSWHLLQNYFKLQLAQFRGALIFSHIVWAWFWSISGSVSPAFGSYLTREDPMPGSVVNSCQSFRFCGVCFFSSTSGNFIRWTALCRKTQR